MKRQRLGAVGVSRCRRRASPAYVVRALSVELGACNYRLNQELAPRVDDVMQAIARGVSMRELILVEDGDRLVVLEGNTRATAYVKASTSFSAFAGSSLA